MRILIVDDELALCEIVMNSLDYVGYDTAAVHAGKQALDLMKEQPFDIVLLDLKLPDMSGIKVLQKIRELYPQVQCIMISGQGTIPIAVKATQMGAYDFIEKPLSSNRVLLAVKNALDKSRLERDRQQLLENVKARHLMIGESRPMLMLKTLIEKAAATHSKVLIEGENGTGKELVARAIHNNSNRVTAPFVAINCAAIPESLIESELFGHCKGAFTGAVENKIGRIQKADGGTLFLDEIGDMSLMTQAKILRVLEDNCVEMVGGKKTIPVDVRVIAATNKDLRKQIHQGEFREDLYFRLNVIRCVVPPLRERAEDIPLLLNHYLDYFSHEFGVAPKRVDNAAMVRLLAYHWPGNVRQLKNIAEKLVVLSSGETIEGHDLNLLVETQMDYENRAPVTLREAKQKFEKDFIVEKLAANHWNVRRTAELLDIPRTYLHTKIKQLNIQV